MLIPVRLNQRWYFPFASTLTILTGIWDSPDLTLHVRIVAMFIIVTVPPYKSSQPYPLKNEPMTEKKRRRGEVRDDKKNRL